MFKCDGCGRSYRRKEIEKLYVLLIQSMRAQQLEEEAKRLETKPDVLIYNALRLMLEKLKRDKSAQP